MVTYTTTYNFAKPTVGDDEDVWGGYLNGNFDTLESLLKGTTALSALKVTGVLAVGNSSPKTWHSNSTGVIQFGGVGALENYNASDDPVILSANQYRASDGNFKYIETNEATRMTQYAGEFYFQTAPSGTADTNATFTTRLKINNGGNVGIGTDSPSSTLDVNGNASVSGTFTIDNSTQTSFNVEYANDGAGIGPLLRTFRDSASPAVADALGGLDFKGNDSGGNETFYARIKGVIIDPADTTEDGAVEISVAKAGTAAWETSALVAKFDPNGMELRGDLRFEGATANNAETTLTVTDPTADRTITFPDATGTVWTSGNDGSGSGLDADTVDGIQASSFLRSDASDSASGDITFTGFVTFDNDTSPAVKIISDNFADGLEIHRNHSSYASAIKFSNTSGQLGILYANSAENLVWRDGTSTNVNTIWHTGNDGSGSGLDADTLDGYEPSTGTTTTSSGDTIVLRNTNGDLWSRYGFFNYLNMNHSQADRNSDTIFYSSTDSYIRKNTATGFKTSLGLSSTDSPTFDGMTLNGNLTISSTGTIGGSTLTNGYLQVTDGSNTLAMDSNEIVSNSTLYIKPLAGTLELGGSQTTNFGSTVNINGNLNAVDNIYVATNIYHEGDTNTYVGFATDQINFVTGGATEMQIKGDGVFLNGAALHEEYVALSGTTPTCDPNSGGGFSLTLSGNTTFTFGGTTASWSTGFIVELTGHASTAYTVTWPTSVDWAGGTAPDAPASGETDIYVFWTRDGGTTWYGVQSIDAAS